MMQNKISQGKQREDGCNVSRNLVMTCLRMEEKEVCFALLCISVECSKRKILPSVIFKKLACYDIGQVCSYFQSAARSFLLNIFVLHFSHVIFIFIIIIIIWIMFHYFSIA